MGEINKYKAAKKVGLEEEALLSQFGYGDKLHFTRAEVKELLEFHRMKTKLACLKKSNAELRGVLKSVKNIEV